MTNGNITHSALDAINASQISKQVFENKPSIIRFLGYGDREIPLPIHRKIDSIILDISPLLDIQYEYKIFHDYAFAIYTVGELIEEKIREYIANKEMMNSLILDKAAIVALDCIKDAIIAKIEHETKQFVSNEIYPASKNFPIQNQKMILDSMKNIDKITINQYFQLAPIKSVGVKLSLSTRKKKFNRCKECEHPCENKKASILNNRC